MTMPDNNTVTKRMNYFDRQFLRARDFQDEQAYHLDRNRRHLRLMHTPGWAEGLEVTGNVGETTITVGTGTAIDPEGREIVLAEQRTVDLLADATRMELYILFGERETDSRLEGGVEGNTRIEEVPDFARIPIAPNPETPPALSVLLAVLTLDNGALAEPPDNSVRNRAGTVFPNDLELRTLTLTRDGLAASQFPSLTCSGANEASLDGDLRIGDHDIRLQGGAVNFDGLGWYGPEKPFANTEVNGPVLYGRARGALGTTQGGQQIALAWDNNGNVGVGTTSPDPGTKLHIAGGGIRLEGTGNADQSFAALAAGDVTRPMRIGFGNIGGEAGSGALSIQTANQDDLLQDVIICRGGSTQGQVEFWSGGAEIVRVENNGNVGIGTTNPDARLHVRAIGTNDAKIFIDGDGDPTHDETINFQENGTQRAVIGWDAEDNVLKLKADTSMTGAGGINLTSNNRVGIGTTDPSERLHVDGNARKTEGGASWVFPSDKKLKKNIKPLEGAAEKLLKLRGISFEWKEPEKYGHTTERQMGLVAQEVETIFPEWVHTDSEGIKNLQLTGFEAVVIEVFKELASKIEKLEAENAQLIKKVKALEGKSIK
jgi:hypothetical protein